MKVIRVSARPGADQGRLQCGQVTASCSIGSGGITEDKREGDGCTPAGSWPLRRVFYRPDRLARPATSLPVVALRPDHGWGDDQKYPDLYNRLVTLPACGSHERMWREDGLYDLVVEIGYNDSPAVPGLGSAIFLHIIRPDWKPTAGCVAVFPEVLLHVLEQIAPDAVISIGVSTA